MKRTILTILPLLLAVACVRGTDLVQPERQAHEMVFHARMEQPDTRTVRMENGDIYWSPGDVIRIFHGKKSALFTAQNTEPAANVDFAGSFPEDDQEDGPFYALYGANAQEAELTIVNVSYQETPGTKESVSVEVPFNQAVPENTFAPGAFPSVAIAQGNKLYFENLCGGAVLTVKRPDIRAIRIRGNRNERICGNLNYYYHDDPSDFPGSQWTGPTPDYTVSVTPAGSVYFTPGVKYYVSLLPATLEEGLTITYLSDNRTGTFVSEKSISIQRSQFGRLPDLDERATWTEEMANCYVVKPGKTIRFPSRTLPEEFNAIASMAPQAAPTRATPPTMYVVTYDVLWESYGTGTKPTKGSVVRSVSRNGDDIVVTAGSREGNAVVAMLYNDVVAWSWHIWVTNADLEGLAQTYRNGAGTAMDRNLGALSATEGEVGALGLLYQWGRKDPFPGASAIDGKTMAATTVTWPSAKPSNAETGTPAYAVANPMVFISSNTRNYDWYYTGTSKTDYTRWNRNKGFFDPCPPGWQVPQDALWTDAFINDTRVFNATSSPPWTSFNPLDKGGSMRWWFGTDDVCWYPAAGYLTSSGTNVSLYTVGSEGRYWSCEPTSRYTANMLYFSEKELRLNSAIRSYGQSVRCVKSNP